MSVKKIIEATVQVSYEIGIQSTMFFVHEIQVSCISFANVLSM
jgi:hypothetical protein